MTAWYNDNEPYVRRWLQALRAAGHILRGFIDHRPIQEVRGEDLDGFRHCHFFAGVSGWPLALAIAGWPEDREVWTGSCPCQPFSIAGQGRGVADDRHVWPEWLRLIRERRPATIFGEQVASPLGREWLAGVRADLEELGYAVGAADLCAAGVGAPQIRQRLWWVANSLSTGWAIPGKRSIAGGSSFSGLGVPDGTGSQPGQQTAKTMGQGRTVVTTGDNGGMGGPEGDGRQRRSDDGDQGRRQRSPGPAGAAGGLAESYRDDSHQECANRRRGKETCEKRVGYLDQRSRHGGPFSPWDAFDLVPCADGKSRRVEPGTFPLAHGVPNRVGRLRAYGNAIVPQVAAEFVRAFMETESADT